MSADLIDELLRWSSDNDYSMDWWKTSRTTDHRTVIALPPHDSLYVAEIFAEGGKWTLRHGDFTADRGLRQLHVLSSDRAPEEVLEAVVRSLIAEAAGHIDQNADWALALAESAVTLSTSLAVEYLSVAAQQVALRARRAADDWEPEWNADASVTRPKSTAPEIASAPSEAAASLRTSGTPSAAWVALGPQAPLNNAYFNKEKPGTPKPAKQSTAAGPGKSITALVMGIVGYLLLFTWWSVLLAIGAISFGSIALVQKDRGRGMAIAGVVLGSICFFVALALLFGARRPGS